jgi:O-acetylhomoserine/O-acetylserine sulfhydrylase-like pyridoxal-dependent enzyme
VPIYQSTSFDLQTTERADRLVNFEEIGFVYSRIGNPTQEVLEERLAAIKCGVAVAAVASGQAATALAVLTLVQAGDNIVTGTDLYAAAGTSLPTACASLALRLVLSILPTRPPSRTPPTRAPGCISTRPCRTRS